MQTHQIVYVTCAHFCTSIIPPNKAAEKSRIETWGEFVIFFTFNALVLNNFISQINILGIFSKKSVPISCMNLYTGKIFNHLNLGHQHYGGFF